MTDFNQRLHEAKQKLDSGDAQGAFQILRWVFHDLNLSNRTEDFSDALGALAPIAAEIAGDEFAEQVRACSCNPSEPQEIFDLAGTFGEEGVFDIAACLAMRARLLVPEEEEVTAMLADLLEEDQRHEEAYEIVKEDVKRFPDSFYMQYLLAFHAIMCADLENARTAFSRLTNPPDEDHQFLTDRISAMLARCDEISTACDLGPHDLRGWHYLVTGSTLTHVSPLGFDEGMNGRYAFTGDSYERCKEGLLRLKEVIAASGLKPQRIIALPERNSNILAMAAANLLELPYTPWESGIREGLVIAYDLADLNEENARGLYEHHPGQILFAHATSWTDPIPYVADITTYLYQQQQSPWDERMELNGEEIVNLPADEAPPKELAARIANAELEEDALADLDELKKIVAATGEQAAFRQKTGSRSPLWPGPVTSNRFG